MSKILIIAITIFFTTHVMHSARDPIKETHFRSPVKYTLVLAGSFGELRSRHFHAGLDIKPHHGGEGDSIFSAEDGFISKIKILRGGYGKVMYVTHPNGYTTVYAHLKSFNAAIDNYISAVQKSIESYEIDVDLDSTLFNVSRGQHIAFLGNTGRSSGPHLHFEIRETISDNPMNPLLFGIKPFDDIAPTFTGISIAGLDDDYQKKGQQHKKTKKTKGGSYAPLVLEVDGDYAGISVSGFDQNNGSSNRNGIYKMEMYVDDVLYYGFNINTFTFAESPMIEAHTDYELRQTSNRTEVLCYKLPGNTLSIIDYQYNNGLIPIDEGSYKNVKIVLKDFEGNQAIQLIEVRKKRAVVTKTKEASGNTIYQGQKQVVKQSGLAVTFYAQSLTKNIDFNIELRAEGDAIKEYKIGSTLSPILTTIRLAAHIPDALVPWTSKLGFMLLGDSPDSFGQSIEGDSLVTYVDDFGRYGFFVDTIAPVLLPQNFSTSTAATAFKFKITDNVQTRYKARPFSYNVWLDGVWLACEYKEGSKVLTVPLKDLYTGDHHLRITASDQFDNTSEWQSVFVYQKL
jgi:murein DD-endopeptidase MepM/ murein hydrolase activator NlpD